MCYRGKQECPEKWKKIPFFQVLFRIVDINAASPDQQGALSALYSLKWDIYLEKYKSNYNLVISLF